MEHTCSPLFAAIDLGSNSFHMLIVQEQQGSVQTLAKIKQKVRLAAGLDDGLNLSPEAMARGWHCLSLFAERLQDIPATQIKVVATAALRAAKNADVFLATANQILGHSIEIISGEAEAHLIYQGAAYTSAGNGKRLIIDIGGASTEIIIGEATSAKRLQSLDMGCVTWLNRFFAEGKLTQDTFAQAIDAAKLMIQPILKSYRQLGWQSCMGASGTIQALQEIMQAQGMNEDITLDKLYEFQAQVIRCQNLNALQIDGLSVERTPVFPSGLAILIALFESFAIETMQLATGALREGLVYSMLMQNQTPFDPKQQSIKSIQARFHVDRAQAQRVSQTALSLLAQVDPDWIPEPQAKPLLWAAAQLHEMGLAIQFKDAQHHAAYLLKHQNLIGFSLAQKALLVQMLNQYQGPRLPLTNPSPLSHQSAERLIQILRLAVILCHRRQDQAIITFELKRQAQGLVLQFPNQWQMKHPLLFTLLKQEAAINTQLTIQ